MYTVVSAHGVGTKPQSRWGIVNITNKPIADVFNEYRELFLTLSSSFFPDNIIVDLNSLRVRFTSFTGDVDDMLAAIGNETLATVESLPTRTTKFAYFEDMFRQGYRVDVTGKNSPPTAPLPRVNKTNLRVFRDNPSTDMGSVFKHCMITVNGYFHNTDTDGDYLYVVDGGKSNYLSKHNNIGMLSFRDIGELKNIPITPSMVYKQAADSKFHERAYIKLPENTQGKTVMLVLGGYLVLQQKEIFWPVGDNTFGLNLSRLPLIERYYESRKTLDLTELGLDGSTKNESMINMTQFYSDEVIMKYLGLSQSFFVVLDTPEIFTNKYYVGHSPIPCNFTCTFEPIYPLVTSRGKMSEYWKTKETGVWSLRVVDSFLSRRVLSQLDETKRVNVSDSSQPQVPHINAGAHLLEIGSDFVPAQP